jgi:hypothetical protein
MRDGRHASHSDCLLVVQRLERANSQAVPSLRQPFLHGNKIYVAVAKSGLTGQ